MVSVTEVVEEMILNPELEEWGLEISSAPHQFETRILQKPLLITASNQKIEIIDKSSFNHHILCPVSLKSQTWAIVYDHDDYDEANALFEFFTIASERYGLLVEDPEWIEVPSRS